MNKKMFSAENNECMPEELYKLVINLSADIAGLTNKFMLQTKDNCDVENGSGIIISTLILELMDIIEYIYLPIINKNNRNKNNKKADEILLQTVISAIKERFDNDSARGKIN